MTILSDEVFPNRFRFAETEPVLIVQLSSTSHWPSLSLRQKLLLTTRRCDGRAQLQVVRTPFRLQGTVVHLLGDWACPAESVFRAFSEMFSTYLTSHD